MKAAPVSQAPVIIVGDDGHLWLACPAWTPVGYPRLTGGRIAI